ncbi:uncharacterized protein LOC121986087 [Zingiber officinale]|uniref:Uncharacterized protein n=1 Tax=Zingiber officinale TaxID=94328 RepID=A0A8J5GSP8_ZINOF|nr:uncharacterized protein LOC121986087 [Zingiber officinale]KAG6505412.1 hypothetical protein ZIOFF_037768 [Zingiber officinale]
MPQVNDLEALVFGGGDTKVACEPHMESESDAVPPPAQDPDLPPESHLVRIGSARDPFWADVAGASVYERDDSTKGSTNPKAQAQAHANSNSKYRSNSQRFSAPAGGGLQVKPPIMVIPGQIQHHSGYLGRSGRRHASTRIFPKKLPAGGGGGGRKSAVPDEEPGSPKVSCIGKVLSQRERNRCRRQAPRSQGEGEAAVEKSAGCWASLSAVLCCGARSTGSTEAEASVAAAAHPAKATADRMRALNPAMESSGLGAMTRFASGRRSASWCGNGDDEEVDFDLGMVDQGSAACSGRRSVGSLDEAERERETDGSASV